jgi:hypothetical protein
MCSQDSERALVEGEETGKQHPSILPTAGRGPCSGPKIYRKSSEADGDGLAKLVNLESVEHQTMERANRGGWKDQDLKETFYSNSERTLLGRETAYIGLSCGPPDRRRDRVVVQDSEKFRMRKEWVRS